ncbi:MAG: peptidyl-prolyl cis-trans isomerase, cyclophilin type [Rhizorhabdus sp.]|nr:peptidyl-prolyl cis-trans isomerase, cyclophilin type [Rhizorhabdus sp.]
MMIRIAALALFAATPALAQEVAPPASETSTPPVASVPKPAMVKVRLVTSEGPILLELEKERAPITTANFLHYVDTKRFDGMTFYRAVAVPNVPEKGLVQGGVHYDPRKMFPPIAHEPTSKTGVLHTDGTISMARNAPGSATGDFFITIGDMPYMDADPTKPGDNVGYAAFGHVVEGMDVLRRILAAPTSPTLGAGIMKGQMLAAPVKIVSAKRVK